MPLIVFIFYLSIFLFIICLPLVRLYGLMLCPMVWIEWARDGKDLLIIHTDSKHSKEWEARLAPFMGNRAVFLNYGECEHWDRWSLPAQLYEIFGPHGMPERFTEGSLPSAIVFRKLHWPRTFNFGTDCKDREDKLEVLCAVLTSLK
jgi:hypothetical protein